jgi:hypothetical protein
VLSDYVDSEDEDAQRRYKRQNLRELYAGLHNRRVRTWNIDFGCPFCNQKLHHEYESVLAHARGRAVGSFKQKYSRRVAYATYVEYLEKLHVPPGLPADEMWD